MKRRPPAPIIELRNAQRAVPFSASSLQSFAKIAIALVWDRKDFPPQMLDEVVVSVVSDKRMAQLHKQFCGVAGPTDVLTFDHGEIVISAQTAARQARLFQTSIEHELRLYLLHGLLHLCGHDDTAPRARAKMERSQRRLLELALRAEQARAV